MARTPRLGLGLIQRSGMSLTENSLSHFGLSLESGRAAAC